MASILVIDDSPAIVECLREFLTTRGHSVLELATFVKLPYCLRNEDVDLIILDLHLPAFPQGNFGEFIRKFQPRPLPILIFSGESEPKLKEAVTTLSADGYFQKGGDFNEFGALIDRILETAKP